MQLILAIDSDLRRAEQLASLVHARLQADLVQATSAGEGLLALQDRIPDLILTPPLLSPFDDGVLDEYLRDLGAAGAHVQTVRIPMLNPEPKRNSFASRLLVLGLNKTPPTSAAAPDGCDPNIFADEIAAYLSRAASARQTVAQVTQALARHDEAMSRSQEPAPPAPATTRPAAAEWSVINDDFIAKFTDTPEPADLKVVEPQYVTFADQQATEAAPPVQAVSKPTYVEPIYVEPTYIEPTYIEPTPPPEPIREAKDKSATFEAALAAIRAAWMKPDAPAAADFSTVVEKVDETEKAKDDTRRGSMTSRVISIR